jgi:Spx/MgsR family transcriptional regulator
MLTMYGIKNCDTIKKARRWLEAHQIEYRFHDYRADGLDRAQLDTFIAELGWEALLNTRGTTWRKLDESLRNSIDNADAAAALMLEMPAIIKRPLLCAPGRPMLLGLVKQVISSLTRYSLCLARSLSWLSSLFAALPLAPMMRDARR